MSKLLAVLLKGAEAEFKDSLLGLRAKRVPSKRKKEARIKYGKRSTT